MKKTSDYSHGWHMAPAGAHARIPPPLIERIDDGSNPAWRYQWRILLEAPGLDTIDIGGAWFSSNHPIKPLTGTANAALVGSLAPLMALGLPVVVEGGVSPALLRNLTLWQSAFAAWYPPLRVVPIEAPPAPEPAADAGDDQRGDTILFSLGVDSWFSALRHHDNDATLVFIDGFDLTLDQVAARADLRSAVQAAAAEINRPLVVLQSNLRDMLDRWLDWFASHGTFLGAASMLLEGSAARVFQPSSARTFEPDPWGSNPLTDPLFTTERLRTIYDAGELQRMEKLIWLLDQPVAMRNLRVCWSGTEGRRNCGRCSKCLRTMIAIHLFAGLQRAPLFPSSIDLEVLANTRWVYGFAQDTPRLLPAAAVLDAADDPVFKVLDQRLRDLRVESLLNGGTPGSLKKVHADQWGPLLKRLRDQIAGDFMAHAPKQVNRALAPAVPKVAGEALAAMWHKDRGWLQREAAKTDAVGMHGRQ